MSEYKKPHLDKISKLFLEKLEIDVPLYELTPDNARKFLKNLQKKYYKPIKANVEHINIFDENADSIDVELVRPANYNGETLPLLIYCHGGGWVMGDFEDYEMTVKTISNRTNCAIAFVEYSRAPEFQYPLAIKQVYGTLKHFVNNGNEYNIFPERIALGGDSAGANLAITTAIKAKYDDCKNICVLALIYPVTDSRMKTASYKDFKNGPYLSKKTMEYFWDCYEPDKKLRENLFVSPINAKINDLKGLPTTLIITAENDVLRDEGEEFARKLIEADVDCACVRINNTFHDFILINGIKNSISTEVGYKLLCSFLSHEMYK